jgi:hypothetical protein
LETKMVDMKAASTAVVMVGRQVVLRAVERDIE